MTKWIAALVLFCLAAWALALLPGVYGQLPVHQQIAVYGTRLKILPFPSEGARSAIAQHAAEGASALAEDLSRETPKLMPSESAYILAMIQHRGTSLRGTPADLALRQFLASGRAKPADVIAVRFALNAIEKDVRLPPELQPR